MDPQNGSTEWIHGMDPRNGRVWSSAAVADGTALLLSFRCSMLPTATTGVLGQASFARRTATTWYIIGQNQTAAESPVLERRCSGRERVVDRGGQREERQRKLLLRLCAAPIGGPEVVSAGTCVMRGRCATLGRERRTAARDVPGRRLDQSVGHQLRALHLK